MPEENNPPAGDEDDNEFITVISVQFSDDENTFGTLDFLGWNWEILETEELVSYGVPEQLAN